MIWRSLNIEWEDLIKSQISRIKKLVINHQEVPDDAKLFRATTMMEQLFINDEVKVASGKS